MGASCMSVLPFWNIISMRTLKKSSPSVQTKIFNACVHKEYSLDWKGLILLNEEGISTTHLPARLRSVEVIALNVVYCGIGIRNEMGGMEFYSAPLCRSSFTVKPAGITCIPRIEGHRSDACCVFADMMDYLAYLTLLEKQEVLIPACDCIIMGAISNFMDMLHECKMYAHICCFLPNTIPGRTMFLTINSLKNCEVKDFSCIYGKTICLHQYVKRR